VEKKLENMVRALRAVVAVEDARRLRGRARRVSGAKPRPAPVLATQETPASIAAIDRELEKIGPGPEATVWPAVKQRIKKPVPRTLFRRTYTSRFGERQLGRPRTGQKSELEATKSTS
jgi:hypothetical protein